MEKHIQRHVAGLTLPERFRFFLRYLTKHTARRRKPIAAKDNRPKG